MLVTVRQNNQELLTLAFGESMTGVPADVRQHLRIGGVSELFWGIVYTTEGPQPPSGHQALIAFKALVASLTPDRPLNV